MSDLTIPDISEWQSSVGHAALVAGLRASYGAAVVIARINYGNSKVDAHADQNIDGLRAAQADALGWYCYLVGSDDPSVDADVFSRVLLAHGGLRRNEFVVCDDEEGSGDQSARVNAFFARVDSNLQATGSQDMWYSGLNFAMSHNLEAAHGRRWIAAYGSSEPTVPHDLWQFTNANSFPGISGTCDASVFHGSGADFLRLIGAAPLPALAIPPEVPDMADIARIRVPNANSWMQYWAWVTDESDGSGHLMVQWYDENAGSLGGPMQLLTGLMPRTPITATYDAEIKQLHFTVRGIDGRPVDTWAMVNSAWSMQSFGSADAGPVLLVDVIKLAAALAPQIPQVDEAKLAADLEAALPPADAAAVKAALATAFAK